LKYIPIYIPDFGIYSMMYSIIYSRFWNIFNDIFHVTWELEFGCHLEDNLGTWGTGTGAVAMGT